MKISNKTIEYLLVGMLVGIIVLAVVVIIYQPWTRPSAIPGAPTEFRFRCTGCGHEWSADYNEMLSYYGGALPVEGSPMVDCPKCGEKKVAFRMIQCPACRKFSPPQDIRRANGKFICPHCGIDIHEWYRKQARKRR